MFTIKYIPFKGLIHSFFTVFCILSVNIYSEEIAHSPRRQKLEKEDNCISQKELEKLFIYITTFVSRKLFDNCPI